MAIDIYQELNNQRQSDNIFNYQPQRLQEKPKKESYRELGATGTQFFSGLISGEEYLTELQGSTGLAVYDKMLRNDAQVHGTFLAITLPIRQAKWYIEPPTDKQADKDIAERIQKNLLEEMTITWDDTLRQNLSYLSHGFSLFEKVFMLYEDNLVLLKKLAPRQQDTINKWFIDDNGGLEGIEQYVKMGEGPWDYINIPIDKLILFVNELEGSNYEGKSILRPAYKHWYIKDQLYKIDAIGHDRWASGVPIFKEPEHPNEGDRGRVATIGQNLHSREKSYLQMPYGWEAEIFEKSSSNESIIKSIQHHNEEIAKNVLAQFINLGTTSSGSRALGESFEELFMQSLNAVAGYIADGYNRYVIKQLVDLNWNVKEYPRLKASRIMLNVNRWLEGIAKVGLSNAVTRDNDIENIIRDSLGLPELSPEMIEQREIMRESMIENLGNGEPTDEQQQQPPQDKSKPQQKPDKEKENEGKETEKLSNRHDIKKLKRNRHRDLTEIEKQLADFDEIENSMDKGVDNFNKQVMKIKKQQAEFLSQELLKKTADKIKMPFIDKLADRLYQEQKKNVRFGRRNQKDEIDMQKALAKRKDLQKPELLDGDDFQNPEDVDQFLRDKSKADAQVISNKTLGIGLFALYNLDPGVTSTEQKQQAIFDTIMTTGNADINNIANASVNKAYGLGREIQAQKMASDIEICIYSAVLDDGTCENCAPKDGQEHELGDPDYQTPNPECRGGDKCRCINICKIKG